MSDADGTTTGLLKRARHDPEAQDQVIRRLWTRVEAIARQLLQTEPDDIKTITEELELHRIDCLASHVSSSCTAASAIARTWVSALASNARPSNAYSTCMLVWR